MKVFISWSGQRSKKVAELFEDWLPLVIQAARPWLSQNIDRGALWFNEIMDRLAEVTIGIVCITEENKNKPWILFESGALIKGLTSTRVCTFLIDLEGKDLESPLGQFNHTFPNKESVWQLIQTIKGGLPEGTVAEIVLQRSFDKNWDDFKNRFDDIIQSTESPAPVIKREENDILGEVLETVRGIEKRMRDSVDPTQSIFFDRFTDSSLTKARAKFIERIASGLVTEGLNIHNTPEGKINNSSKNQLDGPTEGVEPN